MAMSGGSAVFWWLLACNCAGDDTGQDNWAFAFAGEAVEVPDTRRPDDLSVAAVEVRFGVLFGEDLVTRGSVSSAEVKSDGTFVLGLPEAPPDSAVTALSNVYEDTLRGALYWVVVFEDVDGDGHLDVAEDENENGQLDAGEDHDGDGQLSTAEDRVLGADMERWLVYLSANETPGDTGQSAGWPLGWSLVDLSLSGQYEPNRCLYDTTEPLLWMTAHGQEAVFYDLSEGVEVPLAGLAASLTMAGELGILADGVVALPYQHLVQGEDLEKVFDTRVDANAYEGTVLEPPPASHDINNDPDWRYTYAIPVPYTDLVHDEEYTEADDLENATLCAGDQQVYLRYTRPVANYRGYRFLECYGATVGWRMATTDGESGAPIFWNAAQSRSADFDTQACPLW